MRDVADNDIARPVVGYVSGVFDMFHIGHLNVIMQARSRCDHLVVGVVTDDVVRRVKQHDPVIPLRERLDIIRGLRDVDAVIEDPYVDKFDTWTHVLPYDVLFKGDDWRGTPRAQRLEQRLGEVGARIEYFPYTAHTSSTLLRDVLTRLAHTPVEPDPGADQVVAVAQEQLAAAVHVASVVPTGLERDDTERGGRGAEGPGRRCPTCGQPTGRHDLARADSRFGPRLHHGA